MGGPSAVAVASETLQGSGVVEGLDSLLSASTTTDATFSALSRVTMRWSNEELLLAVQGVLRICPSVFASFIRTLE